MRKVLFITPRDAEPGFALAGAAHRAAEAAEAPKELLRARAEADVGVVAIDERLLPDIPGEMLEELEKRWDGVVVVLPAPELPGTKAEDYALELIRRTIGYHLRLSA